MICEYKEKECEFWDGECLAVDPSQCPFNSEEDVEAIRSWQRRQIDGT